MAADIGAVFGGLILLFLGGEGLVRGSVALAERFGLSKLLIGLTIVAFGTSAPELVVAVDAALSDSPEIALGNVVGSNIANVMLILGIAVLIAPIVSQKRTGMRDALIAGLVSLGLFGLVQGDVIGTTEGIVLLSALLVYLVATYWLESRETGSTTFEQGTEELESPLLNRTWILALSIIGGIGALVFGADLLVTGSVSIARSLGVSDAVIGLSLVAIGTSLPELATAVVAAYRRHTDVVLGNVIGSNIFNILAIMGVTAVIQPVAVSDRFRELDTLVMLGAALVLIVLLYAVRRIGRAIGAGLLLGYLAYMTVLFVQ